MIQEFLFPCPLYAFAQCADAVYTKKPLLFWASAAVIHFMTWGFIILSCSLAPRSWQDKPLPPRSETGGNEQHWRWWKEGSPEKRNAVRGQLLNENAYYWLAGRPYVKPAWVWTFLVLVALWMLRTAVAVGHFEQIVCVAAALLLNSTLKLWIALEAGQQLAADRKSGAFELLLSTPLTVHEIVRGQLLALARQFLKPVLVVIGVEFCFMLVLARPAYHPGDSGQQLVWMWLAGIIMLAADAAALSVVAMTSALSAKSYTQASMRTVRYILALPWILFGLANLIVDLFLNWSADWYLSWKYELALWFALGIGADFLFGWAAWRRLRTDFREMALRAFGPLPSGSFARWSRQFRLAAKGILTRPIPADPHHPRSRFRKPAIFAMALVLCGVLITIIRPSKGKSPPPVIISLGPTNTPLRIFSARDGVLFVLPDGSLWRWGKMDRSSTVSPRVAIPERVGTNSNWVQAFSAWSYTIGLRRDGTVWELDGSKERQVDPGHDWVKLSGGYNFSVLLKSDGTLWGWGDNSFGQLGSPPNAAPAFRSWGRGPTTAQLNNKTDLVQIGTNSDWKSFSRQGTAMVALRQNGTLWMWGNLGFFSRVIGGNSIPPVSRTSYPYPVQVCRETNWVSITDGYPAVARNDAGELWNVHYLLAPPSGVSWASSVLYRIGTISTPADPAFGLVGEFGPSPSGTRYEVRSDGTLWGVPIAWWPFSNPVAAKWKQIGNRHDWISVWGDVSTIIALTSDGTVWTWGTDLSREAVPSHSVLQTLSQRLAQLSGQPPNSSVWSRPVYPVQKEPRPLIRMVLAATNQTTSAQR